jgi:hypothetical protein
MDTRRAALVFGIVFLAVGILGFIPGANQMHHGDPHAENLSVGGPGHGNLLGLFHVNVLHNGVHLLFGVMGLAMARTLGAARSYFRIVGVAYLLLAVMGLVSAANMHNTFGLVPIHGNDVWLHALLGAAGIYFGFIKPAALEAGDRTYDATGGTAGTTSRTGM